MTRRIYQWVAAVVFLAAMSSSVFVSRCYGQTQKQETNQDACKVEITNPRTGTNVGPSVNVDGTATIKPGTYVWVFAHRKGLAIWWPQGSGAAQIRNGVWSVLASIGSSDDRGFPFEILVGVVDSNVNNTLNGWVQKSDESGEYKGIRLPVFVSACGEAPLITVIKTN